MSNGKYVSVPHDDIFNITGDLTISMWVKPDSITCSGPDPAYVLVSKRSSNIQEPYEFMIGCGGTLRYAAWGTNIVWPSAVSTGTITTGVWQHVAMTRSFSGITATVTFYINGVAAGSSSQDSGPTLTNSDPVWISRSGYFTGYTNEGSYSGLMDEVQIYNRAVSSSEITQIYNNSYSSVANIVGNWKLDETSGTTASDSAIQNLLYCGGDCNEVYNQGTVVALTATPDTGSTFTGWSGDADCSDGSVTMDADKTCTATFNLNTYTVTTTATNGTITSSVNPTVNHGSTTTVTGSADANHYFTGVSGCGGTTQTNTDQSITSFSYNTGAITANCTVTANFAIKTYTLTVNKTGTGSGAVTATGIDCGADCSEINDYNTNVILTATPDAGSTFTGWSGDADCSDGQVTMNADKTCIATFTLLIPDISASTASLNFGNVNVGLASSPQTVTVSNNGTGNLNIGSVSITGTDALQFIKQADVCSGNSLAPSETCNIQIVFRPASTGSKTATLTIASNDPDEGTVIVTLTGNGTVSVQHHGNDLERFIKHLLKEIGKIVR